MNMKTSRYLNVPAIIDKMNNRGIRSFRELATLADVSPSGLHLLLKRGSTHICTAQNIAKALECQLDEILSESKVDFNMKSVRRAGYTYE